MNINSLLSTGNDALIVVSVADLKEFALELLSDRKTDVEKVEEEHYLSCADVVEKLGVTRSTLWRWNNYGYLKAIKVGAKTMYRQSDVNRIMEG